MVADSAYAGKVLRGLPDTVTWTTRLRSNAGLYELAPGRTGRRGRPKMKGAKLPSLAELAKSAAFVPTSVARYGVTTTVHVAVVRCLWYGVFGPTRVQVVLVRDKAKSGYDVALVSTDLSASPAEIVERYAARLVDNGLARHGTCAASDARLRHRGPGRLPRLGRAAPPAAAPRGVESVTSSHLPLPPARSP